MTSDKMPEVIWAYEPTGTGRKFYNTFGSGTKYIHHAKVSQLEQRVEELEKLWQLANDQMVDANEENVRLREEVKELEQNARARIAAPVIAMVEDNARLRAKIKATEKLVEMSRAILKFYQVHYSKAEDYDPESQIIKGLEESLQAYDSVEG